MKEQKQNIILILFGDFCDLSNLLCREREKSCLLWNAISKSTLEKGQRGIYRLLTWTVSGERSVSKIYYPGMSPSTNILKLAANAFAQRTRTTET